VNTNPEQKGETPFVQLPTTQCPRADGRKGRVSFFIYGLNGASASAELDINNGRVYLSGLYEVTHVRDRDAEPTYCWADLQVDDDD
jgi:hypothetical protein